MKIAFDLDNTLTMPFELDWQNMTVKDCKREYLKLIPNKKMIKILNRMAAKHTVYIFTARDDFYEEVTIEWLKKNKVKYEFVVMKKPFYDLFIDDKCMHPAELELLDGVIWKH